jgi:hypothetical protein
MTACLAPTTTAKPRIENAAYIQTDPSGQIQHIEIKPLEGNPLLSVRKPNAEPNAPTVIRNWEKVRQAVCLLPWIDAAQNRSTPTHPHNAALILSYPAGEVAHVEVFGTLAQAISHARSLKTPLNLDIATHWSLCVEAVLWLRAA